MTAANKAWIWIEPAVLHAVHEEQLAEHGGPSGTRDAELFESTLARPRHRAAYGEPDAAELAACYGFSIARNHPFVDGNKRTAFVATELFVMLNGFSLQAGDEDCVLAALELASGQWDEATFAAWARQHMVQS